MLHRVAVTYGRLPSEIRALSAEDFIVNHLVAVQAEAAAAADRRRLLAQNKKAGCQLVYVVGGLQG